MAICLPALTAHSRHRQASSSRDTTHQTGKGSLLHCRPSFLTNCHDNHAEFHCEAACTAALLGGSTTRVKSLSDQLIKSYSWLHAPAAGIYHQWPNAGSGAQPIQEMKAYCSGP